MKQLYVTKRMLWGSQASHLNGVPYVQHRMKPKQTYRDPVDGFWKIVPAEFEEVPMRHYDLFNPRTGSHYIDLDDEHILVAGCFDHSEMAQEIWHSHPEVARLPHPVYEGNVPLKTALEHVDHKAKKFKQKHFEALANHPHLGVNSQDTVLTLALKAKKIKRDVTVGL